MPIRFRSSGQMSLCIWAKLISMTIAALAISTGIALAQSCIRPSFNIPGPPFTIPVGSGAGSPLAIATGNYFSRPGRTACHCDLAVALNDTNSAGDNRLVIMRGSSAGTYDLSTALFLTIPNSPVAIGAGRFRDSSPNGLDDLILVSNTDQDAGTVHIFLPQADGEYITASRHSISGNPLDLAKGDFDGDSKLDFAVLSDNGSLTIMLGDGEGQFSARTVTGLGRKAQSLATGRFTGQTLRDDIAVAAIDAQGAIKVAIVGRSDTGTFRIAREVATGESGVFVRIASANLSAAQHRRDIAVASFNSSTTVSGGRIKLLLGRADGQGFTDGAILTTEVRPAAVNITDMNNDGVADLIMTAVGGTPGATGSITIFRGLAAQKRFEANPIWKTPASQINPAMVATARFTSEGEGIVAANKDLNTISAYVGDGTGVFVNPFFQTTEVRADGHLFVTGDFRSKGGDRKVLDLVYASPDHENGGEVLSVLLNADNRKFEPVLHGEGDPPAFAGAKPLLMIPGRFDSDGTTDLAIIDENPDDGLRRPVLRILLGTGAGRFKVPDGIAEFVLGAGEKPVAMVAGHFRNAAAGAAQPLDIAIASVNAAGGSAASAGRLTILVNDGNGQFPDEGDRLFEPIGFIPEAMVASNRFRAEGKYDIAIKARDNSFTLYFNRGDGRFPRQERFSGPPGDEHNAFESQDPPFLVGDIDANGLQDVVFVDSDMSLDVYSNRGAGRFKFDDVTAMKPFAGKFDLSSARFRLDEFGDGRRGLAALVRTREGNSAILTLRGDDRQFFSAPDLVNLSLQPPAGNGAETGSPPRTFFDTATTPPQKRLSLQNIPSVISGQFASALHGNEKPDLWFLVRFQGEKAVAGACPNDPRPNPGPIKLTASCPDSEEVLCRKQCPPRSGCLGECVLPVCQDPPCHSPVGFCEISRPDCEELMCEFKFIPQHSYCGTAMAASYFTIVGNTCND